MTLVRGPAGTRQFKISLNTDFGCTLREMTRRISSRLLPVVIFGFIATGVQAFEDGAIRSGMSVEEVRAVLPNLELVRSDAAKGHDQYRLRDASGGTASTLHFCEGKLVIYTRHLFGDEKLFIRLVQRETELRGLATDYAAGELNASMGTVYVLKFNWQVGQDIFTLSLTKGDGDRISDSATIASYWTAPHGC